MADQRFIDAMEALREIADVAVPVKGGKTYLMVKDRVEIFRREFGDEFGIVSNVDYSAGFDDGAPIVASCQIMRDDRVIASGWAVEFVGSTKITAASPVEVAETSAIGRALACFGLAGGEYASLNEMEAHERKVDNRQGTVVRGMPSSADMQQRGPVPVEQRGPQVRTGNGPVSTQKSSFWIPGDDDATYQPDLCVNNICAQIDQIDTTNDLGQYWSDLKRFVGAIKVDNPDMLAEIKAAFATRHNAVSGERR